MTPPPSARPQLASRWEDALCLAGVLGMALALIVSARRAHDIGLDDETIYLASGVRMLVPGFPNTDRGLPPASWGPIYSCWYFVLHLLEPDSVRLYHLNWAALVGLVTLCLYALLRALGVRPLLGLVIALLLLTSRFFEVWPYPVHFAVGLILAGTTLAARTRSRRGAAGAVALTLALCVFVRPEFSFAFVVALGMFGYLAARSLLGGRASPLSLWREAGLVGVPLALLWRVFGNPLGGGRAFFAWGQHYALNEVARHHLDVDPWLNWQSFVWRDFGDVRSVAGAVRANPAAFGRNMLYNALAFPRELRETLAPLTCLPGAVSAAALALYGLLLVLAALGMGSALQDDGRGRHAWGVAVWAWFALASATVVSGLIIHPRPHYLLPASALTVALLGAAAGRGAERIRGWVSWKLRPRGRLVGQSLSALAGVVLVVATTRSRPAARDDVTRTIAEMRHLGIRRHVVVLEQGWSYAFYANYDFERLPEWLKDRPFRAYLRDHDVGVVVLSERFLQNPGFGQDDEYRTFLRDPTAQGFRVHAVPGTTTRIAVRADIDAG